MTNSELSSFLKETEYCDFNHPEVQKVAHEIGATFDTDRDKAIALFYWVRDNVLYRVGLWNRKASETLYEREGTCTNKANLLVALLRANNLPAAYGLLKVDGQKYFGPANMPILFKHIGKVSNHVYSLIYLDKWIAIDASDDFMLSEKVQDINPPALMLDWDGTSDARLNLDKDHIFSDKYPIADIDDIIRKKPRNARGIKLTVANVGLKFVRESKKIFKNADEIQEAFLYYLKAHHPIYHRSLLIASAVKDFQVTFNTIKTRLLRGLYE